MTEHQLAAFRDELDKLYEAAQAEYEQPRTSRDAKSTYREKDGRYRVRLREINQQLAHFQFRRDNEYEYTHVLIPKERNPDAFSGLSNMA